MAIASLEPRGALHDVSRALEQLHATLDALGDSPAASVMVDAAEAGAAVREVERLSRRVSALHLRVVACAHRSPVARDEGFSNTTSWLSHSTRCGGAHAARDVALADTLDRELPATAEALAGGDVSRAHADVIAHSMTELPESLGPDQRATVEASLLKDATRLDPGRLRRVARRAVAAVEQDERVVDAHEDRVLRSAEARALARTRLRLHDNGDGTTTGSFTVPTLAGAILRKVVQQLAAPRRERRERRRGEERDLRAHDDDWAHRYGLAFAEILEHLPTDRLSGKVAATVVITMDHQQLVDDVRAARLDSGGDLSAAEARRAACQGGLVPVVLGGASQPLDLGRTKRFFTEAQRLALATRYDTCAAVGCDRPLAWSELHHQTPWASGGTTDLRLAVPLCGWHHRRAHDPTYESEFVTDQHGIKSVTYRRRT